ncbi:fructosamine kinase family protein [Gardnerella vaginalis]|uniref:Fructosamine kinase n=1 Tax=Gardnerella vaginalis TaxID=2702 RepID=A0A133P089_GARVA|nr:fructosamine kinase family protein [Gardnerella vaginalis]EPI42839.1 fructosamine kinase [Gardnerella vaginalis JCP8481A]EPI43414.1 fructosamine kinase [Gardnerella vaginalis JCP8481B]KXA21957.1 fructosamine kinase [Gardnerella vaginalis]
MNNNVYTKSRSYAPDRFFECEGKGLQWMQEAHAHGGPRVAKVFEWGNDYLNIERINTTSPTPLAAFEFGAALAHMHDYGAQYFGEAPADYDGTCYFGPLTDPVPMPTGTWHSVIDYLADGRLRPMVELGIARRELTKSDLDLTNEVIDALPDLLGKAAEDKPARVHGDLWSGNVLWTKSDDSKHTEAVLIDPAAHGGHREEDLAMLHLFGISYFKQIIDGYQSVHPLKSGFEQRMTVWQLYPIAGHCVFFGGGYVEEYRDMCQNLLHC